MRYFIRICLLFSLFFVIAFLSGYKSRSSSGYLSILEIIVYTPEENKNIENPPVSLDIGKKQDSVDPVSINF